MRLNNDIVKNLNLICNMSDLFDNRCGIISIAVVRAPHELGTMNVPCLDIITNLLHNPNLIICGFRTAKNIVVVHVTVDRLLGHVNTDNFIAFELI